MRRFVGALAFVLVSGVAMTVPVQWVQAPSPARASTPSEEWFVAQTGTASFGSGTSCAAPDVVGDDDTAIRTVLNAVTMDDTITICDGVYDITQTLIVDDSIAIQGQSTAGSILDGGSAVQIMRLNDDDTDTTDPSEVKVLVEDLTFRNGNAGTFGSGDCHGKAQCGGAIYVEDESDLTVRGSYFVGNRARFVGGAIANNGEGNYTGGTIRVENSTFYRNISSIDGGAIGVGFTGGPSLTVVNSTFVENRAISRHGGAISESFGGGVVSASTFIDNLGPDGDAVRGNYTVTGSLFAGPPTSDMCSTNPPNVNNTSVSTGAGCGSAVIVTMDSLNLRGLGNWGGPTPTVWIGPGSSAVNANTGTCQALDQRGASRSASPCDAGAYERQGPADEGTAGTLDYASPMFVDETALPTSSPTPSPAVTGRTIGYSTMSSSVCSVDGTSGEVTPVAAGTCKVQWYLAPTLSADGAVDDDTLTISRAAQAPLVIDPVPQPVVYGTSVSLTTTGGSGAGSVAFSTGASTGCYVAWWIDPSLLVISDAEGTCTVTAEKAATAAYDSVTSVPVTISLAKATQTALALQAPSSLSIGSAATLTTSGGSTGQPVTYAASPPDVCLVDGDRIRMLGQGTCRVSATMAGDGNYLPVSAPDVSVQSSAPEPPDPTKAPSPPREPDASLQGTSVTISWEEPATAGAFPISTYQVVSQPSGGTCLAIVPALSCEVTGLTPGRSYSFVVRALNGSGWGRFSQPTDVVTVPRDTERSIVITGSRSGRLIVVSGSSTGLNASTELRAWVRLGGEGDFREGQARIAVGAAGDFTWSRRAERSIDVYVSTADGSATSNVVRIRER